MARLLLKQRMLTLNMSATLLATAFKRMLARRYLQRHLAAARAIQSQSRERAVIVEGHREVRRGEAASHIQSNFRASRVRRRIAVRVRAATKIQRSFTARSLRKQNSLAEAQSSSALPPMLQQGRSVALLMSSASSSRFSTRITSTLASDLSEEVTHPCTPSLT